MSESMKLSPYIRSIQLILLTVLLSLGVAYYLSFLWRKRNMFIKSWNYPGPFNIPIVGASYLFMCKPEYILGCIIKLQKSFPDGFKLWFGNRLIYGLHQPVHIEKVLGSTRLVHKEILYQHVIDALGEGLLQAPAQKWKKHRKSIAPAFNQKVLDSFVEIFAQQSLVFTQVLDENIGKDLDIFAMVSRCTLDILSETALGLQLNIQKSNSDLAHNFDKIMLMIFLKIFQIWNHSDFIWRLLGYEKKLKAYLKKMNDLADKVIKEKMEALEAKKKQPKRSLTPAEDSKAPKLAFLDYIIENEEFTPLELREEILMFLVAGTDTTASTLSFLFAVLGMFPDVQQKVYEEVVQFVGQDRFPEPSDLPHLTYLERVIKETLRIFPVGAFYLRAITEDVDMGEFVIPKGASAFFGLVFIHRNEKYWPDPLRFDPDRFLPEEIKKRHPCSYIPFSYGPRNCIGKVYGMMNMKVIAATVIRKFRICCGYKNIKDIRLKANIVLRFKDGAKVSMCHRE